MKTRLIVGLLLSLLILSFGRSAVEANGDPPYNPLQQPSSSSPYGMDLMGPGWQWTFPREEAWPRSDGAIRVDLMDEMFQKSWAAGVRSARIAVLWCLTEPERDRYQWEELDIAFQLARNYGMEIAPQVFYTPDWAALGRDIDASCFDYQIYPRNLPPKNWQDWSDFMGALLRRYGPPGKNQVHQWEIWNEPDLFEFWYIPDDPWNANAPMYAKLVQLAAREIDRYDPQGKVLVGSLSDIYGAKFLQRLLALRGDEDIRGEIDVLTFHVFDEPERKMNAIHEALGDNQFPLWVTETNARLWEETIPRDHVVRFFEALFNNGVSRTFWFKSWTSEWGPGIFTDEGPLWERTDFQPSPFYSTYQNIALRSPAPSSPQVQSPRPKDLVNPQPIFTWRPPSSSASPIAGYKLQVDNSLFRGKPYFHSPELDVWVPAGLTHFLPLQMVGNGSSPSSPPSQLAPPAVSVVHYQPTFALSPGRYYWRVAAVDVEGNVGEYSDPQLIFVSAGQDRVYLPFLERP